MPSIIEAWFSESEKTAQFGSRDARVPSAAQFDT